jgi:hypothetical protein
VLLVYVGPPDRADAIWQDLEKKSLSGGWVSDAMKEFIAIALEHPLPDSARELFGALETQAPVICLSDFRGTPIKRWTQNAPPAGELRGQMRAAKARNAVLWNEQRRVLEMVRRARYALKTEKYRESVQDLLAAEKLPISQGAGAVDERVKLRREILDVVAVRRQEVEGLEAEKKYIEAIEGYEKLIKDFPLPELTEELQRKVAELWRKIRGIGG